MSLSVAAATLAVACLHIVKHGYNSFFNCSVALLAEMSSAFCKSRRVPAAGAVKVAGPERVAGLVPMNWDDRIGYSNRSTGGFGHRLDVNRAPNLAQQASER